MKSPDKYYIAGFSSMFMILFCLYHFFYVIPSLKSDSYLVKIEQVHIGMNTDKLDDLLGKPIKIRSLNNPNAPQIYEYTLPKGKNGIFEVSIDSTNHVNGVHLYILKQ